MSGRAQREAKREYMRQSEIEETVRALEVHYDRVVGIGRSGQFLKGGLREKVDTVICAIRTRADRLVKKMREELESRIEKFNALAESMVKMQEVFDTERTALQVRVEELRHTIGVQHEELATQEGLLGASRELATSRGETIKTLERRIASGFKDENAAINALRREVERKNEELGEALTQCHRLVEVANRFRDELDKSRAQVDDALAVASRAVSMGGGTGGQEAQ